MRISKNLRSILGALALVASGTTHAGVLATFDDLATPPPLNDKTSLAEANNTSSVYEGILWDSRFLVVGDEYKLNSSSPLFGIPHSPHYFVTNGSDGASGMTVTTGLVLTGAWFGRNEYYGFGSGVDQVTIVALAGATELGSVVFDLPETHAGQPEPLSFVNTGIFDNLTGITGYRIDRHDIGGGHWVADDFQFSETNKVPEPATLALLFGGLMVLVLRQNRH